MAHPIRKRFAVTTRPTLDASIDTHPPYLCDRHPQPSVVTDETIYLNYAHSGPVSCRISIIASEDRMNAQYRRPSPRARMNWKHTHKPPRQERKKTLLNPTRAVRA